MFSTTHRHGLVLCTCSRCKKHFCVDESDQKHQGAYVKPSTARKHKEKDQKEKRAQFLRQKQQFSADVLFTAMLDERTGNAAGRSASTNRNINRHGSGNSSGCDNYDEDDTMRPEVPLEEENEEINQRRSEDACVVEDPMQSHEVDDQVCSTTLLLALNDAYSSSRANELTCFSFAPSYTTSHGCS
jgi:hypothetical protein